MTQQKHVSFTHAKLLQSPLQCQQERQWLALGANPTCDLCGKTEVFYMDSAGLHQGYLWHDMIICNKCKTPDDMAVLLDIDQNTMIRCNVCKRDDIICDETFEHYTKVCH